MQTKSKILKICLFLFTFVVFSSILIAEEFDISAVEIEINAKDNIVIGKGSVEASDTNGRIIYADKITYKKSKELIIAEGSVKILDTVGNILTSNKAIYDKPNETISSYKGSKLVTKENYKVTSNSLIYNTLEEIVSSDKDSVFKDKDENIVYVNMFQYNIKNSLFSSIGKIKMIDRNKNKYFFKELYIDTKKQEMIGSDVSALLDKESFGSNKENDPRLAGNHIIITENESELSKGVFTVCKIREDDKCPPWVLEAKKISHNKIKKTIYYDHAILKVYNVPVFYFPKFFHPDPSVERQSGFLSPFFTDSTTVGTGFGLPYFWAISHDKDMTLTTKTYKDENILFLHEYRQAFKNGFMTLDSSFTEGYKNVSKKKNGGSRNHFFAELDFNIDEGKDYESKITFKTQRVSNGTYFRIHDINTALVDADRTQLENDVSYNLGKDNMYLNVSSSMYEDLRKDTNDRYEFIYPNIIYGKNFFTEKFGTLSFKTNFLNKNYETNRHLTFLNNDLTWSPTESITKNGFVNSFKGIIENKNYQAKNATSYKDKGTVSELKSVLSYKSSLPLRKDGINYFNVFSPNFMFRYAPGNMKNLSNNSVNLNYSNLYSINKTSEIEEGLSAILGFDFKVNEKNNDKEKFSVSMGQVFNPRKNKKMPIKSSLNRKASDLVGDVNYNFSKIGSIGYKFSLDNNFNDLNYNAISSGLNFGKINFNVDYLEERNHVGKEHYMSTGVDLNINKYNKISLATKKNFRTDSTELYDISYQYENDCLTAGLVFKREFYNDGDIEPKDTLMFVIKFVPFTGARAPLIKP